MKRAFRLRKWLLVVGGGLLSLGNDVNAQESAADAAIVHIDVDAAQVVRVVDDRMFGLNTAVWDSAFNNTETLPLLQAIDARALRFPGGSTSDTYDWQTNRSYQSGTRTLNNWSWNTSFDDFARVAVSLNARVFITANYGSGTAQQAADWVTYSNITKGYGFKYWEIGNECYGSWEEDIHAAKQDPVTYANETANYLAAMKAVDPTIKVGIAVIDGEDSYAQAGFAAVTNPRTGVAHKGWTPLLLARLKAIGVTPDFAIFHRYPYGPGSENDASLLGGRSQAGTTWADDAAGLRQQLNDYLGAVEGPKVELVVTENNSVYTSPGKQSTSLVNALFLADSLGNLLQTEFDSLVWWCLRNGPQDTANNNSPSLYGWRNYGDYGVIAPAGATETPVSAPYPTYYMMKLLSHFARDGDQVVKATSDNPLLAAYAVKRTDATLTVLVINKSPTATTTANFTIGGYVPSASATAYSYGIPQDDAAHTGTGSTDIAQSSLSGAGASFQVSFAPYSATVIALSPSAPVAPAFTVQPLSQSVSAGGNVTLTSAMSASPAPVFQWLRNGATLAGAASQVLTLSNVQPADAGLYAVVVTNSAGTSTSADAILGISTTNAVVGDGQVVNTNVLHPNGNHFDQVLVTGAGETITTQGGRITRTSYIDDNDDIVQVEFSGAGTLSLVLDGATGPAQPVSYNQAINYMKGHAGIVITGANETTNVLVFTVGRATAFDITGTYNILLPPSATNVPANNGSPLFQGHADTVYDGVANIAFIAIASTDGKFGGVRAADANFSAAQDLTGIYAPGVQFTGPVYIGEVTASGTAIPVIVLGSATNDTWITGGDLTQTNGKHVQVSGLTQLKFMPGSNSGGTLLPAKANQAVLEQNGQDVTAQIVVNP